MIARLSLRYKLTKCRRIERDENKYFKSMNEYNIVEYRGNFHAGAVEQSLNCVLLLNCIIFFPVLEERILWICSQICQNVYSLFAILSNCLCSKCWCWLYLSGVYRHNGTYSVIKMLSPKNCRIYFNLVFCK